MSHFVLAGTCSADISARFASAHHNRRRQTRDGDKTGEKHMCRGKEKPCIVLSFGFWDDRAESCGIRIRQAFDDLAIKDFGGDWAKSRAYEDRSWA
jgi:hypothetical protein